MTTKTSNMDKVQNVNNNKSFQQSVKAIVVRAALAVMILMVAAPASAQVHLGFKGGLKLEQGRLGGDIIDSDNRIGRSAGLVLDVNLPLTGLGVETGAMLTKRSYGDSHHKQHSIDIPVHARYRLSLPVLEKIVAPYAFTGPEVSVRLNMAAWGDSGNTLVENKTSLSWNVGAGVDLIKHVRVAAAYNISFSKEKEYRENSWSISAAYMF